MQPRFESTCTIKLSIFIKTSSIFRQFQRHAWGCWQQHTAVLDDNMLQVCDEIFIDVHKLLRMCKILKALHTINVCFSGKHASRTCRFNHLL